LNVPCWVWHVVQWHSLLSRGSRRLSWYWTFPQWQLASYLTSKSLPSSWMRYGGRCFHSEMPVVSSPRSWWSLPILRAVCEKEGECRVRCEEIKRARGSAERSGRRRRAVAEPDMKVKVRKEWSEYGGDCICGSHHRCFIWCNFHAHKIDVTMIQTRTRTSTCRLTLPVDRLRAPISYY
jgi:hypothetical protein